MDSQIIHGTDSISLFFPITDLIFKGVYGKPLVVQQAGILGSYVSEPLDYIIQILVVPVFFCIAEWHNFQLELDLDKFPHQFALHILVIWPCKLLVNETVFLIHNVSMVVYKLFSFSQLGRNLYDPETAIALFFENRMDKAALLNQTGTLICSPTVPEGIQKEAAWARKTHRLNSVTYT